MLGRLQPGMRQREPRTSVLVPCRVKREAGWSDACIHNVSSRGLLLGIDNAPNPGSYLEIRRGTLVIIGRVMWRQQGFVGIRTQDKVSAPALVNEPRGLGAKRPGQPTNEARGGERRSTARLTAEGRTARRIERNRHRAQVFQFVALAGAGAAAAAFAAVHVRQALDHPFAAVGAALDASQR